MESAFAWLGKLFEFFGSLLPRLLIIKSSHKAVKYVHGSNIVVLDSGLHVYWPIVTEVEMHPVVRQVLNLRSQIIETSDGVNVVVGGLIVYEVDNIVAFLAENENSYQSIDDIATAAIRKVIISTPYDDVKTKHEIFDNRLTQEVGELLVPFGVSVEYARLTDFAKARVIHISGIESSSLISS